MMKPLAKTALRFLIINLFTFLSAVAIAQDNETPLNVNIDKIIAKVDNYIILKSDLERAYLDFLSRGEFGGSNVKCQILESLVINKMLVAKVFFFLKRQSPSK